MSYTIILVLIFSIITSSLGQIFLNKGAVTLPSILSSVFGIFQNKWLFWGTILFIVSFFSYIFILSKIELKFAYPATVSIGIILVAIGSQIFLGEQLNLHNIIGIILIISGILLLVSRG